MPWPREVAIKPTPEMELKVWRDAAADLGFAFVADFVINDLGTSHRFVGLLPEFGSAKGMLILAEWGDGKSADVASARGYGYSCVSVAHYADRHTTRDGFVSMLTDWGWSAAAPPPSWYSAIPADTE